MEIWTDIEFTMPTDGDYRLMELIAKKFYDDDDHWPVEEYNPEKRTVKIESVLAEKEDAVGFATELLEGLIKDLLERSSEETRAMIENFSYKMHGHTDEGGYVEYDYIIERCGDKLTMKESSFSHEDFYDDFDDEEDDDDENTDEYDAWVDNPDYGAEIDLKTDRIKDNEVVNINELIVEYLKENNLPHDEAAIRELSVEDVYDIMAGTYGKNK